MTKVEALEEFDYDHKTRKVGDQFETVAVHHAVLLVNRKKVKIVETKTEGPSMTVIETAAMKAEEPAVEDTDQRRKKRYTRRDMRPEE